MTRMQRLVSNLKAIDSKDWWIKGIFENPVETEQFNVICERYNNALSLFDNQSLGLLTEKAIEKFKANKHKGLRGKHQLFDILNEALAYEYLVSKGYTAVSVLEENEKTTPDLMYIEDGFKCFCEVKTINKSDDELNTHHKKEDEVYGKEKAYDAHEQYEKLNENFICKLSKTLKRAINQFPENAHDHLIFLVIHFDDSMLAYIDNYETQIKELLHQKFPLSKIYIRTGVNPVRNLDIEHNIDTFMSHGPSKNYQAVKR